MRRVPLFLLLVLAVFAAASNAVAQDRSIDPDSYTRFQQQIQKQLAEYQHGDFLYQHCDIFQKIMERRAEMTVGELVAPVAADFDVHDTSYIGDITRTTSDENETSIAINRSNPNLIVAGANDAAMYSVGMPIYVTTDAGNQWHTLRMPDLGTVTVMPGGDPVLAAGPDSMMYYAYLIYDNTIVSGSDGISDIIIARSTNGYKWTHGTPVLGKSTPERTFEDKETIGVDTDPTSPYYGRLYVAWVHYDDNFASQYQMLAWSDDGGDSWSEPVNLSDSTGYFSCLRVGGHGVVYLSSSSTKRDETDWMMVSYDGGKTFSKRLITNYISYPINRDARPSLKGIRGFRAFPYTSFDVDRSTNQVYLTYGSWQDTYAAIYAITSLDDGITWSEPRMIGTNGLLEVDHFLPWVAVDQVRHQAMISFYSSEDDPTENLMARFSATSFNDLSQVEQLGTETFDPLSVTHGGLPFIGDYVGADAYSGYFATAWTENRKGRSDGDVYAFVRSPKSSVSSPRRINAISFDVSEAYPMPSPLGVTHFEISMASPKQLTILVTDPLGRKVTLSEIHPKGMSESFALDLSAQPRGVYHVIFSSGAEAIERSVVVGTD